MLPRIFLAISLLLGETSFVGAMELCTGPARFTCVVDGDTVWIEGEKIRLEGIDAPEPRGRCYDELVMAAKATERLRVLLEENAVTIERSGKDRYGRTLAKLRIGETTAGDILVKEGLVRVWRGRRESWC